jgi:thiamine-phosphate pyrophosphorylase
MLRCAITDGEYLDGDAGRWAGEGVDLVQLRAKTLEAGALADHGRWILRDIAGAGSGHIKLLINGRVDVAVAIGADGVHLTAREGELTPEQVRAVFAHAGRSAPLVSVSCHTIEEVTRARDYRVDYILFGPVFEKRVGSEIVQGGVGLELLREACEVATSVPVLALGGVTEQTIPFCLRAGARGVAGIRLFS